MLLDDQVRQNQRRTVVLFALLVLIIVALFAGIGAWLQVPVPLGIGAGLVFATVYILVTAATALHTVLSASRARPANAQVRSERLLLDTVEELAIAAGLPVPHVYVQDDPDINAFAAGHSPASSLVCVTTGALEALDQEELEGVVGHEMSHIRNHDVRVTTYAVAVVAFVALLFDMSLRMLRGAGRVRGKGAGQAVLLIGGIVALSGLAYVASRVTFLALSRQREYLADASGAQLTRDPEGLGRALEKIAARQPEPGKGDRTVAALYLDNPFRRLRSDSVWSTHPPLGKRIARLGGPFPLAAQAAAAHAATTPAPSAWMRTPMCAHCGAPWAPAPGHAVAECPFCGGREHLAPALTPLPGRGT